ncbi:MAG: NAD(P)H-hydrate dehydratase, partial [Betaproteobacteria bacterium]
ENSTPAARARAAGVLFSVNMPLGMEPSDLCIDALLGIGSTRAPQGHLGELARALNAGAAPVLAVDLPSGMDADTGNCLGQDGPAVLARHSLSLLTLKPGLFTAQGRDLAGQVWHDELGVDCAAHACTATLLGRHTDRIRAHASHKGSFGDVAVVGGATGMTGAALLAARAAVHAGAGRVYVALFDSSALAVDLSQPELMFRDFDRLNLDGMTLVCGCGGGEPVRSALPRVLATAWPLVLDADALNAIAIDTPLQALLAARGQRARTTVLTPHPLEAARLLGCSAAQVQAHRLHAAQKLADRFACITVLKGSGTVIAAVGQTPAINATGNARLATAGSGDVLAGMVGAGLASGVQPFAAACEAVYSHGAMADAWPDAIALSAGRLARQLGGSGLV